MRLIDADAFIWWVDDYYDCTELGQIVIEWINDRPTIEPKRGRWLKEYNGNGWNDYWDYTCSVCEKTLKRGEPYPYCPNCGARMEASDD